MLKIFNQLFLWILILSVSSQLFGQQKDWREQMIGTQAPFFKIEDLNGNKYQIPEVNSQLVIVLNFWFMGCTPCIREFSVLNRLKARIKDKKVIFIAICTDEDEELVRLFLKRYKLDYQVVVNGRSIAMDYKVQIYPSNLVIDTNGNIIFAKTSYHEDIDTQLEKAIQKALGKKID